MTTAAAGRSSAGRFAAGNPGGPGRPRRLVEADYLHALTDACPIDTWREIVVRAVEDAKAGDAKARSWLAGHLLGAARPGDLLEVAAADEAQVDRVAERARDLRLASLPRNDPERLLAGMGY
jgi:hypothetical protein